MSETISKNLDNKAISLHSYFPTNESDQVIYNYDCKSDNYKFIAPGVTKLLGYGLSELNELKFEKLIISEREEFKSKYPLKGKPDGAHIEEKLTVYFVETNTGENKWIEDKSISIYDSDGNKTTRMGLLRDVGEKLHEEKLKQIILEILEAANSEQNLSELFRFIHSSINETAGCN